METSPECQERLMKLVTEARQQAPAERESFLRQACETDPALYREIAETLKWEDRMGSFLQQPLIALTVVGRPFQPGEVIEGRFEIVRAIGEGGMGVVYEAIDRKRNLRIAIIHGDLKSSNIILCPEENGQLRAVITDFGLASGANQTSGEFGGTPDYMAPELWRGQKTSRA